MAESKIDTTDEEAVVKGIPGYKVVWEDSETVKSESGEPQVSPTATKEEKALPKTTETTATEAPFQEEKTHKHHTKERRHPVALYYWIMIILCLLWLLYVNFALFILGICASAIVVYAHYRKMPDIEEPQTFQVQIIHPIKTGFQIALGMGFFAVICAALGLVLVGLVILGAAFGLWSGLSLYIHP